MNRIDAIIARLPSPGDETTISSIKEFIEEEWLDIEIISFLRNTEEVNPDLREELALKRMKRVLDQVTLRLGRPALKRMKEAKS